MTHILDNIVPTIHRLSLTQHTVNYAGPKTWKYFAFVYYLTLPRFNCELNAYILNTFYT